MAFTDRVVQHPGRVRLTNVSDDIYDITPYEGEVTAPGTLLNAANLNQQTQLDSETVQAFFDAGASMDKQNDMSGALAFLIEKDAEDYVAAQGYATGGTGSNTWYYRKWKSGMEEAWGVCSADAVAGTAWASPLYHYNWNVTWPDMFTSAPTQCYIASRNGLWIPVGHGTPTKTGAYIYMMKPSSSAQALNVDIYLVHR